MSSSLTQMPRHILKLSTEEKRSFIDSFDFVFSDMDGVIWNLYSPIPKAEEGFKLLENAGKNLTFITNNSVRPLEASGKKFQNLAMDVDVNTIWHPASSIAKYLKSINFQAPIYVIANDYFKKTLHEAGLEFIDSDHELADSFVDFMQKVFVRQPVGAVVIDTDFNMSAIKLIRAQLYLKNPNCLFLSGATDMLLPVHEDAMILGPGQFLKVLTESTKRSPIALGKPGAGLADLIKKTYKINEPKRALMIGDMLEQDIGFGRECGFQTLAVLSGGCKFEDLSKETNPQYLPDYYADSMADFIEFMRDIQKSHV